MSTRTVFLWIVGTSYLYVFAAPNSQRSTVYPMLSNDYELTPLIKVSGESGLDEAMYQSYETDHSNSVSGEKDIGETTLFNDFSSTRLLRTASIKTDSTGTEDNSVSGEFDLRGATYTSESSFVGSKKKTEVVTSSTLFNSGLLKLDDKVTATFASTHSQDFPFTKLNNADDVSEPHSSGILTSSEAYIHSKRTLPIISGDSSTPNNAKQSTPLEGLKVITLSNMTDSDRSTLMTNVQSPIVTGNQMTFSAITEDASTDESLTDKRSTATSVSEDLFSTMSSINQNDVMLPKDVWQTSASQDVSSTEISTASDKTISVKTKLEQEVKTTLKAERTSSTIPTSRISFVSSTLKYLLNSKYGPLTSSGYPKKSSLSPSDSKETIVPSMSTSVSVSIKQMNDLKTSTDDETSTTEINGLNINTDLQTSKTQMNGRETSDNKTSTTQLSGLKTSTDYETTTTKMNSQKSSSKFETSMTSRYLSSTTQMNGLKTSSHRQTYTTEMSGLRTSSNHQTSSTEMIGLYTSATQPNGPTTSIDYQTATSEMSDLKTINYPTSSTQNNDLKTSYYQPSTTQMNDLKTSSGYQTSATEINGLKTSNFQTSSTPNNDVKISDHQQSTTEINGLKSSPDFQISITKIRGITTLSAYEISTKEKGLETSSEHDTTSSHATTSHITTDIVASGNDDEFFSDSTPAMSTLKEAEFSKAPSTSQPQASDTTYTDLPTTFITGDTTPKTTEKTTTATTATTAAMTPLSTASRRSTTDDIATTKSNILTTLHNIQTTGSTTLSVTTSYKTTATAYSPSSTTEKCTDNQFMHNFKCFAVEELIPGNLNVKITEDQRYEVLWKVSSVASQVVINYVVIWTNTTSSYNSTSPPCDDGQCVQTITHTTPGSVWNVSIIPQTSYGYFTSANIMLWTVPSEPTHTTVRGLNGTCLEVKWQQGIGCADMVDIRLLPSAVKYSRDFQNRCDLYDRPYAINACGLELSSVYNITFHSVNGPRRSKGVTKHWVTYPAPVRDLTVSVRESTIYARWNYTQGTVKASFNITIRTDRQPILIKTTRYQLSQGGLDPGKCYEIEVKTVNTAGVSQGRTKKICIQESIPTTPVRQITLVDVTAKTIQLQWNSPERPNGIITRYLIKYCLHRAQSHDVTDPPSCSIESTPSNATRFTVKRLLPFQNYSIRILPSTRKGNGTTWCDHLFVTTREEVPGRVSSVKIQSSKRKLIHVSWSPPLDRNGIVVKYVVNITAVNCTYKKVITVNKTIPLSVNVLPNCQYRIQVYAATKVGPGPADSHLILVRKIKRDGDNSDNGGSSLIIGLVASAVILSLLGALAFVLFKIWKRKVPAKPRVHISVKNEEFIDMEKSVTNLSKTRPIKVQNFICHVEDMHRTSNIGFSEEYKLIKQLSPKYSTKAAEQEACRTKNRYTNVLAFDHSRVKLLPQDDDEGSDYINANYITGYNGKREYIAAQGPLPCTKDDFWRLIWEHKVSIVVMLTQCMERGRIKCEKYWPDTNEPVYFGDLIVQLRSESVLPDYVIRILDVTQGGIKRVVKHFHFLKWPDFGCPEKTWLLLNFVCAVRGHMPHTQHGPTLVHCSAGVGRTGTFIAVDYELQHIKDHSEVDIFGLVVEMREHRPLMVQTENQYVYIHDCIRDALVDDTDEEASLLDEENGEPLYQNL